MKTFMLMMFIMNPNGGEDAYILDHDLSATDCEFRKADFNTHDNPWVNFSCEETSTNTLK